MDNITLRRIKSAHPLLRDELKKIYTEILSALTGSAFCRFAYVLRTFKEQDELFKKRPRVTKAKAGQSYHNYGLAVDIVLITEGGKKASWDTVKDFDGDRTSDWMEIVAIFKKYGWSWGGEWNFKDNPHFEKRLGYTWQELYALHLEGKVDSAGYVQITSKK